MFCVLQIYPVDKVGAQHYSWEEFVEKISVDEYEDGEDLSPLLEELAALHEQRLRKTIWSNYLFWTEMK